MCTHWKLERDRPNPGFLTESVIFTPNFCISLQSFDIDGRDRGRNNGINACACDTSCRAWLAVRASMAMRVT